MAHCLDQPYEFSLICWEFGVMRSHRAAENAMGPPPWCRTAPNPDPEASQSTMKPVVKSGNWGAGPVVRAFLSLTKASVASGDQRNASLRSAVSGAAIAP